jgi:hypothetical protein
MEAPSAQKKHQGAALDHSGSTAALLASMQSVTTPAVLFGCESDNIQTTHKALYDFNNTCAHLSLCTTLAALTVWPLQTLCIL